MSANTARSGPASLLTAILALALIIAAPATAGATRPAADPPFPMPDQWAEICDAMGPAGSSLVVGTNCRWLRVDGVPRRYVVEVPDRPDLPPDRAWPVVLVLTGATSTGERIRERAGWVEQGTAVGAITVYPTAWSYKLEKRRVKGPRWQTWTLRDLIDLDVRLDGYPKNAPYPARDLPFMTGILDDLAAQATIDRRRIHATGHSNGGRFAARLAVELPGRFASVSCIGWCDGPPKKVRVSRATPVLYGLGSIDHNVLSILGRDMDPDPTRIPMRWPAAKRTVLAVAGPLFRRLGLDLTRVKVVTRPETLSLTWTRSAATGGRIGPARVLVMRGVDHMYPTLENGGYDFAAETWRFFENHPMP